MSIELETDNKKNAEVNAEVIEPKDFNTITMEVSTKYIVLLQELFEKYKYHPELAGQLEIDIKGLKKNMENENYLLYFLTSNYLFCLEPVADHNIDYFMYQKDKTVKKSGKVVKNKITKVIGKITLKKILKESEVAFHNKFFSTIYEIFMILTVKNENDSIVFNDEYIQFIKDNLSENKNFSKMLMVMDNLDTILSSDNVVDETNVIEEAKKEEADKKKDKKKKSKSSSSSNPLSALTGALGGEFMNGLESTKIAQLAKNISEKINTDDFPLLNDPMKLLSSLTGGGEEGNNNIQNLLKFVVGEVEDSFKTNNVNESELLGEAQNIMSKFQGMSGFDPMSLLKNLSSATGGEGGLPDMKQFESIFANIQKNK